MIYCTTLKYSKIIQIILLLMIDAVEVLDFSEPKNIKIKSKSKFTEYFSNLGDRTRTGSGFNTMLCWKYYEF